MKYVLKAAITIFIALYSTSFAYAAQQRARVCSKSFDYDLLPSQSDKVSGVWQGKQKFSNIGHGCAGFIVYGVESDNSIKIRYFWNVAEGGGVHNNSSFGDGDWRIRPQQDGSYVLVNKKGRMVLNLVSPNKLVGKFTWDGQTFDMEFDKVRSYADTGSSTVPTGGAPVFSQQNVIRVSR